MATVVQEILDAAYAKSTKNRPGTIAAEAELMQVVLRSIRGLFSDAVDFNRRFYAKRIVVPYDATEGGWIRPDTAESVIRIELGGVRVAEVSFDDTKAEAAAGVPAVYSMGQVFYSAGNAQDPVSTDSLTLFCSMRPRDVTALVGDPAGTLDPLWPEQFNELLILDVAIYLALKDGNREGEVAAFGKEREREYIRYAAFLTHETTTLTRRHGHEGRINTERVQAI